MSTLDIDNARRPSAPSPSDGTPPPPSASPTLLQLVSAIAHDLRGPLTALTNSSSILAEDLDSLERDEVRQMLEGMRRRAVWLQSLVQNLLYAEALGQSPPNQQRKPLAIVDVAEEVAHVVEPVLQRREQRIRVRAAGRVPLVAADGRHIGQVLVNLLLNASKFSKPGTRIDVVVRQSAARDAVCVSVADRGPGLPPGVAERLFDAFVRGDTNVEGVGLGLAIVKSIVDAHHGRVGAQQRRGGGARFWFTVPLTGRSGAASPTP